MLEPDQWDSVLANVKGTIVRGTERVSATRLLDLLDVGPDPAIQQRVGKRLVGAMRRAGWSGPKPMRIPNENGHAAGANGYWRALSRSRQPSVHVGGDADASLPDDLPAALEEVTRLGLRKLARVLRMPLNVTDGNLLRAQVTAAGAAINAQLRADEQRLKVKVQGDVLERLLAEIEKHRTRQRAEEKLATKENGGEDVPTASVDVRSSA